MADVIDLKSRVEQKEAAPQKLNYTITAKDGTVHSAFGFLGFGPGFVLIGPGNGVPEFVFPDHEVAYITGVPSTDEAQTAS